LNGPELRQRLPVGESGERLSVRLAVPDRSAADAPAILYLHGFGSRQGGEKGDFFRARALADGLPFCSFDARGHGDSEGSISELSLSRNLEDLATVRSWLEGESYERIALFGSSMGGATALWHAARHPDGILAAAHIAPAVAMLAGLERWAGPEGLARWRSEGRTRFTSELVDSDLGWGLVEDLRRYPLEELSSSYRTPTILFQGRLDASVDWRDVDRFARAARRAPVELVLYERGDHRLLDRLDEIWTRARDLFLRQARGA